jgi:mRNA-degrading endonuclease HigB of HigAB toxin-antitoxin module
MQQHNLKKMCKNGDNCYYNKKGKCSFYHPKKLKTTPPTPVLKKESNKSIFDYKPNDFPSFVSSSTTLEFKKNQSVEKNPWNMKPDEIKAVFGLLNLNVSDQKVKVKSASI